MNITNNSVIAENRYSTQPLFSQLEAFDTFMAVKIIHINHEIYILNFISCYYYL